MTSRDLDAYIRRVSSERELSAEEQKELKSMKRFAPVLFWTSLDGCLCSRTLQAGEEPRVRAGVSRQEEKSHRSSRGEGLRAEERAAQDPERDQPERGGDPIS
jgi:hypothetical protein